jgi:coproporphyrinogen III oxidase-like Fe-S oxidoreductase
MLLRYNVKVEIDVISRNPFETEEDSVATIRALLEIKKPYRLVIFSMAYYFGTEMYNKAVESGFITNRQY